MSPGRRFSRARRAMPDGAGSGADLGDVLGGRALAAVDEVELHPLTLGQRTEAAAGDGGVVDEAVLAAVLGGDEAEALRVVEPLHGAGAAHWRNSQVVVHRARLILPPAHGHFRRRPPERGRALTTPARTPGDDHLLGL